MRLILIALILTGCAKLGSGKDKSDEPQDVNKNIVTYQEERDQNGNIWFQFSNGSFKCFAMLGAVWARCVQAR